LEYFSEKNLSHAFLLPEVLDTAFVVFDLDLVTNAIPFGSCALRLQPQFVRRSFAMKSIDCNAMLVLLTRPKTVATFALKVDIFRHEAGVQIRSTNEMPGICFFPKHSLFASDAMPKAIVIRIPETNEQTKPFIKVSLEL